jgi:hypothetical protein
MSKRIEHIFEDGIEKKRCSRCKQYLPLDHYLYKTDRWDKLSNECIRCISIRNKRRANPEFNIPEDIESPEEIKEYLDNVRGKKTKPDPIYKR